MNLLVRSFGAIAAVFSLASCADRPVVDAGSDAPSADSIVTADVAPDADASSDVAASEAAVDAGGCSALVSGAVITSEQIAMDAPLPAGGTITDGAYLLTSVTAYTGAGGMTGPGLRMLSGAVRFTGSSYELLLVERGVGDGSSGDYSTSGVMISLTRSCPVSTPARGFPFNAAATRFEWYVPPNLLLGFVRQ